AGMLNVNGEEYLILVCSDGAGSAEESQAGSRLACETATAAARASLEAGKKLCGTDAADPREWMRSVHERLAAEADVRRISGRDLACTLLLAVVGRSEACFAQIGDGAIVVS